MYTHIFLKDMIMKFVSRLKNILLFDYTNDPEQKVRKQVWNDNRKFAIIWAAAQLIYWGFCFFMSFRELRFTMCRYVYVSALALSAFAFVGALFFLRNVPRLISVIKIIVSVTILGGGLAIAMIVVPNGYNTITMFASVLLIPVLFVNKTLYNIIVIAAYNIICAVLLSFDLESSLFIAIMGDLLVFSSMGVVLGHFVNKARYERYFFAESAVQLAELRTKYAYYDPMTGLKNRRAYAENVELLSQNMSERIVAVIADIDGLKKMNDTFGHDAGDELIIGTADCLRKAFEGIDTIYRLGGDEFCVILTDENRDIEECLKKIVKLCSEWKGKYVDGISISCGYATSEEFSDINEMLRIADQRMYEAKSEFYMSVFSEKNEG